MSNVVRLSETARLCQTGQAVQANGTLHFAQFDRDGKPLDRAAGWTWNRHGHYDSHIPETFPYVRFSKHSAPR